MKALALAAMALLAGGDADRTTIDDLVGRYDQPFRQTAPGVRDTMVEVLKLDAGHAYVDAYVREQGCRMRGVGVVRGPSLLVTRPETSCSFTLTRDGDRVRLSSNTCIHACGFEREPDRYTLPVARRKPIRGVGSLWSPSDFRELMATYNRERRRASLPPL